MMSALPPPPLTKHNLMVALDVATEAEALQWVRTLAPAVGCFKVGMQLYYACGNRLVEAILAQGVDVFLDLKLHDIPNTVASACRSLKPLGISYLTLHVGGGVAMMEAAAEVFEGTPTHLLGVTLLTSLDNSALIQLWPEAGVTRQNLVPHWATLAQTAGCAGVVCSAYENQAILAAHPSNARLKLVNPGIRWAGDDHQDQKNVVTAQQAFDWGAYAVVMGRSILQAPKPLERCQQLLEALCP